MELKKAQQICRDLDAHYTVKNRFGKVEWTSIYESEHQIVDDLKIIKIPANRVAPVGTYKGYEYIHSFATFVQHGRALSDRQMEQCKRLALEIKKAASISQ